jgi:hypothetical protein
LGGYGARVSWAGMARPSPRRRCAGSRSASARPVAAWLGAFSRGRRESPPQRRRTCRQYRYRHHRNRYVGKSQPTQSSDHRDTCVTDRGGTHSTAEPRSCRCWPLWSWPAPAQFRAVKYDGKPMMMGRITDKAAVLLGRGHAREGGREGGRGGSQGWQRPSSLGRTAQIERDTVALQQRPQLVDELLVRAVRPDGVHGVVANDDLPVGAAGVELTLQPGRLPCAINPAPPAVADARICLGAGAVLPAPVHAHAVHALVCRPDQQQQGQRQREHPSAQRRACQLVELAEQGAPPARQAAATTPPRRARARMARAEVGRLHVRA